MPKNADEAVVRPVWSILSKGINGTGKTILSCSKFFRPTYVFNLEGRFESVLTYYRKLDGKIKDLHYDDFHMGSGFYTLDKQMDQIIARPEYKTVVIASLSSYIHIIMKHLLTIKAGETNQSGRAKGRKIGGIAVNVLEDYNAEDASIIYELLAFLQELKAMGINIILEAHISPYEITTINEDDKQRETQTIFQILTKGKKAPAQVPNYFNEIWLFEKRFAKWDAPDYFVNTVGSKEHDCKTSFQIPSFQWTGIDPGDKLNGFLNPEIKNTPRVDPNAPKVVGW